MVTFTWFRVATKQQQVRLYNVYSGNNNGGSVESRASQAGGDWDVEAAALAVDTSDESRRTQVRTTRVRAKVWGWVL
jgi:hypothetical protein